MNETQTLFLVKVVSLVATLKHLVRRQTLFPLDGWNPMSQFALSKIT